MYIPNSTTHNFLPCEPGKFDDAVAGAVGSLGLLGLVSVLAAVGGLAWGNPVGGTGWDTTGRVSIETGSLR